MNQEHFPPNPKPLRREIEVGDIQREYGYILYAPTPRPFAADHTIRFLHDGIIHCDQQKMRQLKDERI